MVEGIEVRTASAGWPAWLGRMRLSTVIVVGLALLTGIGYVFVQWNELREVKDPLFVGLLLGATAVLRSGMSFIQNYLEENAEELFRSLDGTSKDAASDGRAFVGAIFNPRGMLLTGVIYGCAIAASVPVADLWPQKHEVRLALMVFLFMVNVPAGMGLFSLATYCIQATKIGPRVKINLWNRSNPAMRVLITTTRNCALLAAIYVCFSVASILFSVFPLGYLTLGYSLFAAAIILAAYMLPIVPVRNRVNTKRREALVRLDRGIQDEYVRIMEQMDQRGTSLDLGHLKTMMEVRKFVESVPTFPFGYRSLQMVVYVLALTATPPLLEILLEKLTR